MKKKIVIFLVISSILLFSIFLFFNYKKSSSVSISAVSPIETMDSSKVSIISTDPDPLENTIISENQILKITFSDPLENVPEFKYKIDPEINLKMDLSPDKKTLIIKPEKGFVLGSTYTLFIKSESKFVGGKRLKEDSMYHFKTVTFRGF